MKTSALLLSSLLVAFASASANAQATYTISPVQSAKAEGTSANAFPFTSSTSRRYMQIHSDLGRATKQIKVIGFRISQTSTRYTGSKSIDCEMYMGRSRDYDKCSFFFDKNYITPKTLVMKRKTISFGPGVGASPGPSPWVKALEIPLDRPFIYIPINSLAWELLVHSNSGGTIGTIDADNCSASSGSDQIIGTGCTAKGQTTPMLHTVEVYDRAGVLMLMFSARYCPASAMSFLALGTKNLSLTVPGLCAKLYPDLLLFVPIGTSQANGDLNRETTRYYYSAANGTILLPNPGAGTLYSQIFSIDASQTGIPLAASNGIQITVPAPNATKALKVTRLFNNTGGVTATESAIFTTSSVSYGLPTRFTH